MVDLTLRNVSAHCGGRTRLSLLNDCSLAANGGTLTAIIGPNGAGKSSLLRAIAGQLPCTGEILADDVAINLMDSRARAQTLAYLPQRDESTPAMNVRDLVALGRFAWGAGPAALGQADAEAVDRAMHDAGCDEFASRLLATLSGGERARVALARVFAAGTPLLLLDEPVAALDPRHQIAIMSMLRQRASNGAAIIAVLHDVNLAFQFADRIVWMDGGHVIADTKARAPENAVLFEQLFGAKLFTHIDDGAIGAAAVLA